MTALAPARELVRILAGSQLYGTATPESDRDLKAVILPAARDILLGAAKPTLSETTKSEPDAHNGPGDTEVETHSLHRFLQMLAGSHPAAVEILFAPEAMLLGPPDPLWREVQALGPSLLCRQPGPFVRYCRRQTEAHTATGGRLDAAHSALAWLDDSVLRYGAAARLEEHSAAIEHLAATTPHLAITDIAVQSGHVVRHLTLCGRHIPFTASLSTGRDLACRVAAGYSRRTREAEQRGGADWKALGHAVRIGREAVELLQTGRLSFPLHNAARLLAIRQGQVPYPAVVDEIERVLSEIEEAKPASPLPEHPDPAAAEAFLLGVYRDQVLRTG
jgi:hypothetical protein